MKKILDIILANYPIKILSIVLAVSVWVFVMQKTYSTKPDIDIPLTITVPENMFILTRSSESLQVTLRGPAPVMSQLPVSLLAAEIDLAKRRLVELPANMDTPQSLTIQILPSDIRNLPPDITVTRIFPNTVTVTLDRIIEKRLTVTETLDGKVKDGLKVHQVYPTPKQVIARGPRSVLIRRDSIKTLPVPISDLDAGTWQPTRALDTSDAQGGLADCLRPDPSKVVVWIEVVPQDETQIVKNVPIEIRGLPSLIYQVLTGDKSAPFATLPEVQISGPKPLLEKPGLHAYIDLTDIGDPKEKPEVTREIQFASVSGIQVLTKPASVVVQIRAEKKP